MADDEIKAADKRQFLGLERAEWWLWVQWVLASIVGWFVGGAVGAVMGV